MIYKRRCAHTHDACRRCAHTYTRQAHKQVVYVYISLIEFMSTVSYEFQDTVQLKKDIAFTKNALKASYETKLEERANEL